MNVAVKKIDAPIEFPKEGLDLQRAWAVIPKRACPNCGEQDPYRYHVAEEYEEVTVYTCERKDAQ